MCVACVKMSRERVLQSVTEYDGLKLGADVHPGLSPGLPLCSTDLWRPVGRCALTADAAHQEDEQCKPVKT